MPTAPSSPSGVDGREDVGPKTAPVEVQARRHPRLAVPTEIERQAVETAPETACQRAEHSAVEACGMDEEGGRPVAPEVVQGQNDAVGSRGSSGRHCTGG